MKNLNKIRNLILKQDEELKSIILKYINKSGYNYTDNYNSYQLEKFIENCINSNELEEAKKYLESYKYNIGYDDKYYSFKGVLYLKENNLEQSLNCFLESLKIDEYNVDSLYNMGYLNILLGNLEEALYFYDRCLSITEDTNILNEIENIKKKIVYNLPDKNFTFLMLGSFNDYNLVDYTRNSGNIFIKVRYSDNINKENLYLDNTNIKNYEVNSNKVELIIEYILRNYDNIVLIYNDINIQDLIIKFKNKIKVIYYQNINYYTDLKYYTNRNVNLFLEKECCKNADLIVTNDINFYNYKKIIENRNNIYFIDKKLHKDATIDRILNEKYFDTNDKYFIRGLENYEEYNQSKYMMKIFDIGFKNGNIKELEQLCENLYKEYETREIYHIYISILLRNRKFEKIIDTMLKSKYCKKIYLAEILYLYHLKNFSLLEFIINISIHNFSLADVYCDDYIDYRLAILNFEASKYTASYEMYLKMIDSEYNLINSPISNRNIAYLMYMHQNDNYKEYYKNYKVLVGSI